MYILFVMIGGFFGSISRFAIGNLLHTVNGFPIATLCINIIGCFVLGWFLTFVTQKKIIKEHISLMIGTGFIGSFTTFSTFSVETLQLMNKGMLDFAIIYVLLSIFVGISFSYFGIKLAFILHKSGDGA